MKNLAFIEQSKKQTIIVNINMLNERLRSNSGTFEELFEKDYSELEEIRDGLIKTYNHRLDNPESLFDALTIRGVKTDNHESDLYFPVTDTTTHILEQFPEQFKIANSFKEEQSGKIWYEVPFAYDPYWENKK